MVGVVCVRAWIAWEIAIDRPMRRSTNREREMRGTATWPAGRYRLLCTLAGASIRADRDPGVCTHIIGQANIYSTVVG